MKEMTSFYRGIFDVGGAVDLSVAGQRQSRQLPDRSLVHRLFNRPVLEPLTPCS